MKRRRSLLFLIPAVLLSAILLYSSARSLMIVVPQKRESGEFEALKRSALAASEERRAKKTATLPASSEGEPEAEYPYAALSEQNGDFAGWLSIADTQIDYPVMKPSEDDPEHYLRRDFFGEASLSGCLFIGKGCDADSEAFIIYGHNMNTGTMFGTLDRYADYEYAQAHPDIRFSVPDGERVYRVFAAFQTRVYDDRDDVFKYYEAVGALSQAEYEQAVSSVRAMSSLSLNAAPEYPQQLLFLSTCSYHTASGRFVVAAYRTE